MRKLWLPVHCTFKVFHVPSHDSCSNYVVLLQPLAEDCMRERVAICPTAGCKEISEILMTTLYEKKYSNSLNTVVLNET